MKKRINIWLSWGAAGLCIISIFLIVPIARTIQGFVSQRWGQQIYGVVVLAGIALAAGTVLSYLIARIKVRDPAQYIWLGLVTAAYIYFTLRLWDSPIEAVHFLEYGLLGFLLFNALRFHVQDKAVYLMAFFFGIIVGILDEVLQWAVTDRWWDVRDIGFNAISVGLSQIALWLGIRPRSITERFSRLSLRRVSILFAVNLILLGLCLSNTPRRVEAYTRALPFLSFLRKQEAMSEFKYRHRDPEIGIFFSRLPLAELERQDTERNQEFGDVLTFWKDKSYSEYLVFFPGSVHPFLHEIRVHIFRRDRRLERAEQSSDPREREENFLIAFKENLILEKYFGLSLSQSPYCWDEEKKARIAGEVDVFQFYRSPVSAGVFATLNETVMWGVILALLAGLFFANLRLK